MILILIGFLISLFALINYKKAMALYLAFRIFWHPSIIVLQGRGFPTITLSLLMDMFFLVVFLFKKKNSSYCKVRFPYARPLTAIGISYFVTCFFSVVGFQSEFTRAIFLLLENVIFIWLIWRTLETRKDLINIIKYMSVSFLVTALYGLFEYVAKDNPFINYKATLIDGGITLYSSTSEALRRGYRLISFLEHPIGAGMTMALFCIFVYVAIVIYNEKFPRNYKWIVVIAACLCVPCVALTKMRSCILFLIIALVAVVDFKNKKFYKFAMLAIVLIICAYPLLDDNIEVFLSLFNKAAQSSVGGSSLNQRLGQLDAVVSLFKMSPIGGLGEKFEDIVVNQYTQAALGYESIWFIQMTKHGMVGVIANLYLAYYSIIKIPKTYRSKPAFFLSLSYWVVYTMTSIPSFRTELYFLLLFYFIKKSDIYKQTKIKIFEHKNELKMNDEAKQIEYRSILYL